MNFKKVVALSICAAMVAGMSMSTVMAADLPDTVQRSESKRSI